MLQKYIMNIFTSFLEIEIHLMKNTENEKTTKMHHFQKQNWQCWPMKRIYYTISLKRTLFEIPQAEFSGWCQDSFPVWWALQRKGGRKKQYISKYWFSWVFFRCSMSTDGISNTSRLWISILQKTLFKKYFYSWFL